MSLITAKALAPRLVERLISENPVLAGIRTGFAIAGGQESAAYDVIGLAVAKSLAPMRAEFAIVGRVTGMADAEAWAEAETDQLVDLVMESLTGVTLTQAVA